MDFPGVEIYLAVLATLWGSIWGSFANVAIYRMPRQLSVLRPASRCPHCENPIRWYHNVPILGYIVLRGRCKDCGEPISIQYPLVELIVAVLALAIWQRIAMNPAADTMALKGTLFMFQFAFVLGLVIIIFADLETMLIPDMISLPGIVLGLVAAVIIGPLVGTTWLTSLIGAVAGGGTIWLVRFIYRRLFGIEGMGFGDVKLMAMIGAFFGWESLVFVFLFGSLQGLAYAAVAFAAGKEHEALYDDEELADEELPDEQDDEQNNKQDNQEAPENPEQPIEATPERSFRKMPIPFGPFLSLAALEWLFFSYKIVEIQRQLFML
jgi:leader peptidase (prepilin peptidase) / N-methyltransferase